MSPLELKVLLNIYTSPKWYPETQENLATEFIGDLEDEGIISICPPAKEGYHGLKMRPRGIAYVYLLLNLKLPEQAWIDESGKIIDIK